jgi:protein-S-isoprenylcysteine O-methyltransferase Ste14
MDDNRFYKKSGTVKVNFVPKSLAFQPRRPGTIYLEKQQVRWLCYSYQVRVNNCTANEESMTADQVAALKNKARGPAFTKAWMRILRPMAVNRKTAITKAIKIPAPFQLMPKFIQGFCGMGLGSGLIPLVAGLDALFGWSPTFYLPVKILSLAIFLAGYVLGAYALIENRFFSGMVRIQTDRGQHVVSNGPYGWVRHPGYAGGRQPGVHFTLFGPGRASGTGD